MGIIDLNLSYISQTKGISSEISHHAVGLGCSHDGGERTNYQNRCKIKYLNEVYFYDYKFIPVFKRIFILDRIEYRILFALAKLTKSNNEYYSCCEIYSNNIRIVQDIRIFEYFRIIFNAKMKDLLKYRKTLCFVKMPSVLTIIRPKLNYHSFCF